jgi:hypothetical protein
MIHRTSVIHTTTTLPENNDDSSVSVPSSHTTRIFLFRKTKKIRPAVIAYVRDTRYSCLRSLGFACFDIRRCVRATCAYVRRTNATRNGLSQKSIDHTATTHTPHEGIPHGQYVVSTILHLHRTSYNIADSTQFCWCLGIMGSIDYYYYHLQQQL